MMERLDPQTLRFSQALISAEFRAFRGNVTNVLPWQNAPPHTVPIRVVRFSDGLTSLDNRRLYSNKWRRERIPEHTTECIIFEPDVHLPLGQTDPLSVGVYIAWNHIQVVRNVEMKGVAILHLRPLTYGAACRTRCLSGGARFPSVGSSSDEQHQRSSDVYSELTYVSTALDLEIPQPPAAAALFVGLELHRLFIHVDFGAWWRNATAQFLMVSKQFHPNGGIRARGEEDESPFDDENAMLHYLEEAEDRDIETKMVSTVSTTASVRCVPE